MENKLKRTLINDKYGSYHMKNNIKTSEFAKKYIKELTSYLNGFDYENDSDFIFEGRRKFLYDEVFKILNGEQIEKNPIYFILGNIDEFMCYPNYITTNISSELKKKNDDYNKKGYICKEEKDKLIEMLNELNKYINQNKKELLRFASKSSIGINILFPPKSEFVFYSNELEIYKKEKLVMSVNYDDIKEIVIVKNWQNNIIVNCKPKSFNIYKVSDEICTKIKEITGK